MTAPELKPAGEWQECIVLTSSLGTDHVIRLNTDVVRRIQLEAIAYARYQALTEAEDALNTISGSGYSELYERGWNNSTKHNKAKIKALRDAKET